MFTRIQGVMRLFVLTLALTCGAAPARADFRGYVRDASGAITTFDVPGAFCTEVTAINSSGEVAGRYFTASGDSAGFTRDPAGNITTFPLPGNPNSFSIKPNIVALNDAGDVAGNTPAGSFFLRNSSGALQLVTTPGSFVQVAALNNAGQVGGASVTASGHPVGYLRDASGVVTTFSSPATGTIQTFVTALNNTGQSAGYADDFFTRPFSGFVRDPSGAVTTFNTGGQVTGINDSGQVVGQYDLGGGVLPGFLRSPSGAITLFQVGNGIVTNSLALNNLGEVAGVFSTTPPYGTLGFLRSASGAITTFDPSAGTVPPGEQLVVTVGGLNDAGVVAGSYNFRANPPLIPKPSSLVLTGFGLVPVVAGCRGFRLGRQ